MGAIFKELAPFGIVGLAMFFVYLLARRDRPLSTLLVTVGTILVLVLFEKLFPASKLLDLETAGASSPQTIASNRPTVATVAPAPPGPMVAWVDIGAASSDWTENDRASTSGAFPKHSFKPAHQDQITLCAKDYVGYVAICWDNRTSSSTTGVPTDIVGEAKTWCVYKQKDIKVSTPPSGTAPNGRVYVCGRVVEPK